MRGKVDVVGRADEVRRITPAYAGKRRFRRGEHGARWDHPRICGEKKVIDGTTYHHKGSPPHMRGKGKDTVCAREAVGITPAYAGKSKAQAET